MSDLEKIAKEVPRCLHQVFHYTSRRMRGTSDGRGDCSICTYDPENNKNCRGYVPAPKIVTFYVEGVAHDK